jgi:uncharacterized protein involved in type VI secretion and phage assembly
LTLQAGARLGDYEVAFLRGDLRAPTVLGSLWNGKDKPPTSR